MLDKERADALLVYRGLRGFLEASREGWEEMRADV
jgi:hypothetical protein